MQIFQGPPIERVIELLAIAGLPSSDLVGQSMDDFFGCGNTKVPNGIIGLENLGQYGLLRSLVVTEESRQHGCGRALVEHIEQHARRIGLKSLYLLTETAEKFFENLGYEKVARTAVPDPIRKTEEFKSLCSDTATVMKKVLEANK